MWLSYGAVERTYVPPIPSILMSTSIFYVLCSEQTVCYKQVPGAWLESKVKKVRNGRFCVGRVLSTGSLWVERDRLRLVKHIINIEGESLPPDMADPRSLLTTQASVGSIDNGRRSILDRIRRRSSSVGGCCTM